MRKNKSTKKLSLARQAVRVLGSPLLERVNGGQPSFACGDAPDATLAVCTGYQATLPRDACATAGCPQDM